MQSLQLAEGASLENTQPEGIAFPAPTAEAQIQPISGLPSLSSSFATGGIPSDSFQTGVLYPSQPGPSQLNPSMAVPTSQQQLEPVVLPMGSMTGLLMQDSLREATSFEFPVPDEPHLASAEADLQHNQPAADLQHDQPAADLQQHAQLALNAQQRYQAATDLQQMQAASASQSDSAAVDHAFMLSQHVPVEV